MIFGVGWGFASDFDLPRVSAQDEKGTGLNFTGPGIFLLLRTDLEDKSPDKAHVVLVPDPENHPDSIIYLSKEFTEEDLEWMLEHLREFKPIRSLDQEFLLELAKEVHYKFVNGKYPETGERHFEHKLKLMTKRR